MSIVYVLRHGESAANADPNLYKTIPNKQIALTQKGDHQSQMSGVVIKQDLSKNHSYDFKNIPIYCSDYDRCITTATTLSREMDIVQLPRTNLLLSEISFGEQEGCNVEDYKERVIEEYFHQKLGAIRYKAHRAESCLDVHVRAGLFVSQQQFFLFSPIVIIVSHAVTCLMLHYFLTQTCPEDHILDNRASRYWGNSIVRKYTSQESSTKFKYNGILQRDEIDVLIS